MKRKPYRNGERLIEFLVGEAVVFDLNKFIAVVLSDPHSLGCSLAGAHLLDLRLLFFEPCGDSLHYFLLLGDDRFLLCDSRL